MPSSGPFPGKIAAATTSGIAYPPHETAPFHFSDFHPLR
jgi:hypothetical protein